MLNKDFMQDAEEALKFLVEKGGDDKLTVEQWMLNIFSERVYQVLRLKRINGVEEKDDVHGDANKS